MATIYFFCDCILELPVTWTSDIHVLNAFIIKSMRPNEVALNSYGIPRGLVLGILLNVDPISLKSGLIGFRN